MDTTYVKGAWAASLTPLNGDLSVDHEHLHSHVADLFTQGLDGVALLGTTGEANSFSIPERIQLIERAARKFSAGHRIMIGVGCCAQPDTIALSRISIEAGYNNLLMLPPFFYKGIGEEALFRTYAAIIDGLNDDRARIFIYDIPPVTGLEISVDLLVRLRNAFPGVVVGVKDSSGRWGDMQEACERMPGFAVFAGTEKYLLPTLRAGGAGCISATANVTVKLLARLIREHKDSGAEMLQDYISDVRLALQAYPAISALKALMAISSGMQSWLAFRPPLGALSAGDTEALLGRLKSLQFGFSDLSVR